MVEEESVRKGLAVEVPVEDAERLGHEQETWRNLVRSDLVDDASLY